MSADPPKRLYRCEVCGLDVEHADATDPTSGYGLRPECKTCRSCEAHPETRAAYQRGLQDGRTELGRRLRSMGDDLMRSARVMPGETP